MSETRRQSDTHRDDPRESGGTILNVQNASVSFDMDRGESRVLNKVDLTVQRDEILGVVGESGSGKSIFASALLDAVVDPGTLTGEVTYYPAKGESIDVLSQTERELKEYRWEEVSMVFQGAMSSFNPTKKIRGHFVETINAHGYDKETYMEGARDLLADLYLEPDRVLNAYPHELSGGMKQRTLIALSLVLEPSVLVMDEPTAALDLLMQRSILQLLEDIKQKYDLTIVFITHDLPLVAELADRLAVMYAFEFVEVAPTEEVLHEAAHPYTRALLNVTPNIEAPVEDMRVIEGSSPDPVNVPNGCSYHPRCSLATDECNKVDPSYYTISDTHDAKCHHWKDAAEAIPISQQQRSHEETEARQ